MSPASGTGSSQVFTLHYSSVNGSSYLNTVYGLINSSINAAEGCFVYYVQASNALYLYNDAGSLVTGPLTPGSNGTLSNGQCTLNGNGSLVSSSGQTLSLALSLSFKPTFAGPQQTYAWALDDGGNGSPWRQLGTWNTGTPLSTPPTADFVSPAGGTGTSQVFTFEYSSVNSYGYLSAVYSLINRSISAANGCFVYYVPATNALYLYNDGGTLAMGPITPFITGTLSNSQCTLNGFGSDVSGSGNKLTLELNISFKPAFAGPQQIYAWALDNGGNGSGWQTLGTWNNGALTNTPPTADSVNPTSGTGASQVFTFKYSSVNGSNYLSTAYNLITSSTLTGGSISGANACYVYYLPASNALYLVNDAGSAATGPLTPGTFGSPSNSQCTLNLSESSASYFGNTLTLALCFTFKPAFTGLQNIYGNVMDKGGNLSGWQTLGTWNNSPSLSSPPTVNSLSPASGTGNNQIFTFQYSSVNGSGYLSTVYNLINSSFSAANACYVYYVPASNALYLVNDAGSAATGPATPGSGGTLSNSQCTLNATGSSASSSRNTLTLALSINFKAAFARLQNLYGNVMDNGGDVSGWQTLGSWTSTGPLNTPPTAASVSPAGSVGTSEVFTFQYSSVNGSGYLNTVYALINGSISAANGCYIYYVLASNALYLITDTGVGATGPLTPGSNGALSNSQCTLNGAGSSVSGSGNTLSVALSINFKPAFAGLQNIYGYVIDNGGNGTGSWQTLGTWNNETPLNTPPTADSVSPASGTGGFPLLTFKFSSVNGAGYLNTVYALINGSISTANGCYVYYVPASNGLYLYNDAGTAATGPITPGAGGGLSNSQCTVGAIGSSVSLSGNTLTLAVALGFRSGFGGPQNVYGSVIDNGSNGSGWQMLGTWTP